MKTDKCGTVAGYFRHYRAKEAACTECRRAQNDYTAAKNRARRAKQPENACDRCGRTIRRGASKCRACYQATRAWCSSRATWSQVIGIFLRFDRGCAYCSTTIAGQPEPDHVVPLSRRGANHIGNILPACPPCNRNLLLEEWAADRARRGKPPVRTAWDMDDIRYRHLTSVHISSAA